MSTHDDLIERLRDCAGIGPNDLHTEAADALAALVAERDALREDAERWRYFVTHCEWLRRRFGDDCYSSMSIRLPYDADQSCVAMRNAAIDAARAAQEQGR